MSKEIKYTKEDLITFGKKCFYKGFEKSEGDGNCFESWREEAGNLIIKPKAHQPNEISLKKLAPLLDYSDRYEISIQFWPEQIAVFIAKDGVDLIDYGGDFDFAIDSATEYLNRVNPKN